MKKIAAYILITCVVFWFSCQDKKNKETVHGIVTNAEWYIYSLGSRKGFYKQKIDYSFKIDDKIYSGQFNNGPDIGALSEGDSIVIEIFDGKATSNKVIKRLFTGRKKCPPLSSKALKENAFDSSFIQSVRRSSLPEVEVSN